MSYKYSMPNMRTLLDDVPAADRPEDEALFWRTVAGELSMLITYAAQATEPEIIFNQGRKGGAQYIWEFYVNDLALARKDTLNWHAQNISQWLYAGAIVLQNRKISAHH